VSDFVTLDELRDKGYRITKTSDPRVKIGRQSASEYVAIACDDASGWDRTGPVYPTAAEALANVARVATEYYGEA
jgi:hypothetical protein